MSGLFAGILGTLFRRPKQINAMEEASEAQFKAMGRISAQSVEQLIDQAGRDDVFARARALGWSSAMPAPLWVWNQIAVEILLQKRTKEALDERKAAVLN
ncbi:hypothetical protein LPB79_13295 [Rhizobium sp. T136]|uniref:hypothetical protein n=1 Tax=Rhizobium sp. T136 TaxID=555319 RepID=UPI001E5D5D30|nr:hypothetical protein [Rhizobium sp. T136]UFS83222.1 hypothetical protein LPB79_13295 [Rhizobium sp. T136]